MKKKRFKKKFTFLIAFGIVIGLAAIFGSTKAIRVTVNSLSLDQSVAPANFSDITVTPTIGIEEIKSASSKSIILFTSSWCGSCSKLAEDLKTYSLSYPDIVVYVLGLDENRELATALEVGLTPTLVLIEGEETEVYPEIRIEALEETVHDFNRIGVR